LSGNTVSKSVRFLLVAGAHKLSGSTISNLLADKVVDELDKLVVARSQDEFNGSTVSNSL
jgi:hypothetical protein